MVENANLDPHGVIGDERKRELQKRLRSLERKIQKLDEERHTLDAELLAVTTTAEAERLHEQTTRLATEIETHEHEWLEVSDALEDH